MTSIGRWLISLSLALLVIISASPALAQSLPNSKISDREIHQGEQLTQKAFEAIEKGDFAQAEAYWTNLVEQFPTNPAVWSNRGNVRVIENKLDEAIVDFNQAIELAPNATDPYLNRGSAFEEKKLYQQAIGDYNKVLEIDPNDAMAYHNRGNVEAAQGLWQEAIADYQKALEISPNFAFANANYALALYQTGQQEQAIRLMRNLVRKYPMFPDIRAALTAALWQKGQQGEAESNWVAAVGMDNRYQDLAWVENTRRWPPLMVVALEKFLKLQ